VNHKALNQLLCAAVVNGRFCETLLRDPARALAAGYSGQTFALTAEERSLVMGIKAQRIEEFAAQVHAWISGNGLGYVGKPVISQKRIGTNGYKQNPFLGGETFVELYRTPATA